MHLTYGRKHYFIKITITNGGNIIDHTFITSNEIRTVGENVEDMEAAVKDDVGETQGTD